MCKCLFVEYACACSSQDCPHLKVRHEHYHAAHALFQIDHYQWRHCAAYLTSLGLATAASDDGAAADDQASLTTTTTTTTTKKKKKKKKEAAAGRRSLKSIFTPGKADRKGETTTTTSSSSSKISVNYRSIDENGDAVSFWSSSSASASRVSVGLDASVDNNNNNNNNNSSSSISRKQSQSVPPPVFHLKSGDPRHGDEKPDCATISYEGWCIERRRCRGCEDYWKGRGKVAGFEGE